MGTYVVRRLIVAVPTLLGITVLVFFFLTLIPASPFDRPEIAGVDKPFGLDLGLPIAYLGWLADAIQGNFGYATMGNSLRWSTSVAEHSRRRHWSERPSRSELWWASRWACCPRSARTRNWTSS